MRYLKIIYLYFLNSLQSIIAQPLAFWMFFSSKLIRYALFLTFLYFITSSLTLLGGYTTSQMLIFYLVFILIDTTSQMLYREVYRFRPLVVSGGFDGVLLKPFPALLRVLVGGPDFIDLGILVILLVVFIAALSTIRPDITSLIGFLVLFICALTISTAFHIFVLGIGIMTLSVDHLIMIYRDLTALMRVPVDFFSDSLRVLFTFVLPLGIMFTFPAKALMGLLSLQAIFVALLMALISIFLALKFWHYSLKHYSSASS